MDLKSGNTISKKIRNKRIENKRIRYKRIRYKRIRNKRIRNKINTTPTSAKSFFLKKIILLILLAIVIVNIWENIGKFKTKEDFINIETVNLDEFRNVRISTETIKVLKDMEQTSDIHYIKLLTLYMILKDYDLLKFNQKKIARNDRINIEKVLNSKVYTNLYKQYYAIFNDLKYFPVPMQGNGENFVSFEDSWNSARSYGGERRHEGTDIMASKNIRGYYPIVSITEGIVEKMGWLEQGGYRIGIRSPNGGYFYYAHLYSYAPDIEIGDNILAGELLGFMGDSGYGKTEGTVGNFDVHLHVGIYIDYDGEEISINPYWILKYLEHHKITFQY